MSGQTAWDTPLDKNVNWRQSSRFDGSLTWRVSYYYYYYSLKRISFSSYSANEHVELCKLIVYECWCLFDHSTLPPFTNACKSGAFFGDETGIHHGGLVDLNFIFRISFMCGFQRVHLTGLNVMATFPRTRNQRNILISLIKAIRV